MNHFSEPVDFSPSDAGTAEPEWLEFFERQPTWSPPTERLIVVAPHPDDEVLGAGGLIHTWANLGRHVMVVSVTDGEGADVQRPDLATVRREELSAALDVLCRAAIPIHRLSLPDGAVTDNENRLRSALMPWIDSSTTLIAPFEQDGHPDHEVVGRVCGELAQTYGMPIARYPIWMWHHTLPEAVSGLAWGRFALSPDALIAKQRALACFKSQLDPLHGDPILPSQVLSHFKRPFEAFVLPLIAT